MLKIYFKEKCGRRTEGRLIKTKYPNGNLAIAIDIMEGDRPIAINMLTINLPESSKEENVAFINDNEQIINYVINNKIGYPTGTVAFKGRHAYPEFRFNRDMLNSMKLFRVMKIK